MAAPEYVDFDPNRLTLEVDEDLADEMYLSRRLAGCIGPRSATDREQFSWVTPGHHGLRAVWDRRENPVPLSVEQEGMFCIPYQVFNFRRFQMELIVTLSRADDGVHVDVPDLSLPYLVNRFKELPAHQRTFTEFLMILHGQGFYSINDYDERQKQISPNAHPYYIHWCKGFGPGEDGEDDEEQFENALKHSILQHGGVLAEMYAPYGFLDADGDDVIPRQYVEVRDPDGGPSVSRVHGHALLVIGWRMQQ